MQMLGIIGAMDSEVDNLTERLTGRRAATAAGRVFYTGRNLQPLTRITSGRNSKATAH